MSTRITICNTFNLLTDIMEKHFEVTEQSLDENKGNRQFYLNYSTFFK